MWCDTNYSALEVCMYIACQIYLKKKDFEHN